MGFSPLHPRAEYPRGAASIAHTALGCSGARRAARADLQTGTEPRDPRTEHRSAPAPRKVATRPRVGPLMGCPTPTPPGGGPNTESLAGKDGAAAPTCMGRKALGRGGGEGGRYHWDALLACTAQPRCRARRGAQPMNATKSARAVPRERPSSCPEHFAPTAASNTPYIHTRVQCRKLPAHTARLTDTHNEHNSPAPGLHRGEGGGPRARLQPRSIGVPPTPPPPAASIPAPPRRPTRRPPLPSENDPGRLRSLRCGALRAAPPGPPPPRARPAWGGGGVSERKNHGKVRQIKTKKVQIRGKNIYIYTVRMGKNGPKREKIAIRIGRKYGPNREKKYGPDKGKKKNLSEVQTGGKNIHGPNKKRKMQRSK